MQTEEIIARLARDARPVSVLAPTSRRLGQWALVTVGPVAAAVIGVGLRPDLAARLLDAPFAAAFAAIGILTVSAAFAALAFSVPNARRSGLVSGIPMVAAGAWSAVLFATLVAGGSVLAQLGADRPHPACLLQIATVACVPGVLLWRDVRRAAPLDLGWTAMLVVVAAAGAGALSVAMTCPIDIAAHQVWWHWLPVFAAAVLALGAGERWRRVA